MSSVVVIGGGVAGLTTAYRLLQGDPELSVTVLEAADRPGGRLTSLEIADLEIDAGPDSFVARKPWAVELCRELGLRLAEPGAPGAYVWTDGGLVPLPPTALGIPADVGALIRWPALSRVGRFGALSDLVRKARPRENDEALGALLRRRIGDEATDRLVAPLLGGLFAGDVDELGVRSTFPELAAWERTFGSLIRAARTASKAASGAGPMFVRPVGGVQALPRSLVAAIGDLRVRTVAGATQVVGDGEAFVVRTADGDLSADGVVVATPAFAAADLLRETVPDAARHLDQIRYVSTAVVVLVYGGGTGDSLPDATGFVVPKERAPMTAATFLSRKWPDPAFGDRAVVRCFVGAAGTEDVLDAADEDIVDAVSRHLAALVPLPERADASTVVRWPRSMPQYGVGHLDRVAATEAALPPGIFVVGNAYRGVGIADTVRGATEVAERVRTHVAGTVRTEKVR
ncbi:MAG TPA: protoporphyrinogen oxidase [Actinomycetota bacterium]|jgi:oxygen-dependent protoporphyrinogen oxidase|nr:protoporphyrinogen oxidase [Actinomycetota bacterium]